MNFNLLRLRQEDSVLFCEVNDNSQTLFEHNSSKPLKAASMTKVFIALEVLKRIEEGLVQDAPLLITAPMVNQYGTNVLGDMAMGKNTLRLAPSILVALMIKYSCNSSAAILKSKFFPPQQKLEREQKEFWNLNGLMLTKKGIGENRISLSNMLKLYNYIYGSKPVLKEYNDFLKFYLKTSRNIYYLFDQLEMNVLGSKSGTLHEGGYYWICDSGVFEIKRKKYFLAAIIKRKSISEAVLKIREVGKMATSYIQKS